VNGSSDEKNVFGTRATPRLLGAFFKTSCLDLKRALLVFFWFAWRKSTQVAASHGF
jgi:hypothetical protein